MIGAPDLKVITLRGIPVDLWRRSRDWFRGLVREFEIISSGQDDDSVPIALLQFIQEAQERFAQFGRSDARLDQALDAGQESVDQTLQLPDVAAEASLELWDLIRRAEEFCRSGDMLTVVPPTDVRDFVEWYLSEVAAQVEGADPVPWPGPQAER
jgi:hypothetical protein